MKRFKEITIWVFIIAYLAVALGFVLEKRERLVCNNIQVRIIDSLKNGFVADKQIMKLLENRGFKLIGKNINEINLEKIETAINEYPPIEKAEVYKTINGKLAIDIRQRNPVIRIMDSKNNNYYIDDNGYIMRTSGNYTSRVIIANGHIPADFPIVNRTNVMKFKKSPGSQNNILADLYQLGNYITKNEFWNAQIQQIYVDASGDFELIPRVGSHVIIFGDYNDCETKFDNLMSLYKNGLPVVGWNTYNTINLKFKGQVVCTKRI
jgi:cell division protein FtsQ